MTATLLVIAAHPDDEVLGCGATVCRMVDGGWRAHLLVMSAGVGGRHGADEARSEAVEREQASLREQMRRAGALIGFGETIALDFPDNRMDTVARMDISRAIRAVIERLRPELVFTHHPGDYNWDHARTFEATLMAVRFNPPDFAPAELRTFEVLSSTERGWQEPSRAFHPNLYVDVAATIEVKKQALLAYESEYRAYPHPRSVEAVEYLARRRGGEVGVACAEAFHVVRKLEH